MYKQLLRDLILIKPIEEELVRPSGIVLLDALKDTKGSAARGKVIQVAPGVEDIHEGDEVRYNAFSATPADKGMFFLREEDVLSAITPNVEEA